MGDVAALTWPLTRPGGPLPVFRSRARRCLFGPVDHEKAKVHLEEQMCRVYEDSKLRWNFDFEAGRPLPAGCYKWETVDAKDADSHGGSPSEAEEKSAKGQQTRITDFMRKRKSSTLKESSRLQLKTRRRSST